MTRTILVLAASARLIAASELPAVPDLLWQRLQHRVAAIASQTDGVVGVCVLDLNGMRTLAHNGDAVFPQASVIKIPILVEMHKQAAAGKFRFSDRITIEPGESVGGSGNLQVRLKEGPVGLTIQELAVLMIRDSDNTATNRAIALTGQDNVQQTIKELGFSSTKLQRVMMDTAAARSDRENISTPCEMARLLEMIFHGKTVSRAASDEMIATLKLVPGTMRQVVPSEIAVASKTGGLSGVQNEAGILFIPGRPVVVAVMGTYLSGQQHPVGLITREVYLTMDRLGRGNSFGHLVQ